MKKIERVEKSINVQNDEPTFIEMLKKPPACVDCEHYRYDMGSWCGRPETLKVFNVITGEADYPFPGPSRCQSQRYSEEKNHCGIEGRFFKPK